MDSNNIITSIIKRDNLKKELQRNNTEEKQNEYKTYRNQLKKIINNAKILHYKTKLEQNTNNLKKT